jgi:HEAT repeat protein
MTTALIDVPRCLTFDATYVGPPRSDPAAGARVSTWNAAMHWGGTQAYRRQAVRECLDTVAVLRSYREPLEGETWLIPAASERRLLAQVNAIIALGPDAVKQVIDLSLDADVPDPGRVFAGLLVLGCLGGRDWIEPARNIFVAAALRTAVEATAAIEALCLGPNPEIVAVMVNLLRDDRSRVRSGAARVLSFRGELSEADWHNAINDPDPSVVAAALTSPLRGYDRRHCERALQPFFARRDVEPLTRLALRAGVSLGLESARQSAIELSRHDPSWADAIHALAMLGYLGDARYVRTALGNAHSEQSVRAAGVLGSIEVVPDLLRLLDDKELPPELGLLVRQALATITGLPFVTTATLSKALDLWSQHSSAFNPRVRYRHGHPLTLEGLLQSLRTGPGARTIRQAAYLEMLSGTESRVPHFSAYDFVGVQQQSLRRIEHWLADPQGQR